MNMSEVFNINMFSTVIIKNDKTPYIDRKCTFTCAISITYYHNSDQSHIPQMHCFLTYVPTHISKYQTLHFWQTHPVIFLAVYCSLFCSCTCQTTLTTGWSFFAVRTRHVYSRVSSILRSEVRWQTKTIKISRCGMFLKSFYHKFYVGLKGSETSYSCLVVSKYSTIFPTVK
jgi:hypothetical protein